MESSTCESSAIPNRAIGSYRPVRKGMLCELLMYVEEAQEESRESKIEKSSTSVTSTVASIVFSKCLASFLQLPTSLPTSLPCSSGWTKRDAVVFDERLQSPSTNGLVLLMLRSHVPLMCFSPMARKFLLS